MSQITLEQLVSYVKKNCLKTQSNSVSDENSEHQVDAKNLIPQEHAHGSSIFECFFGDFATKIVSSNVITNISDSQNDISMCSAILSSLLENFDTLDTDDKIVCVTKFFSKMLNEVKKRHSLSKYASQIHEWNKKELTGLLSTFNPTPCVIAFIATYMNINIFVIGQQHIILYCTGKQFNMYKQSIFIHNDGLINHLLTYDSQKIWRYKSNQAFKYFIETCADKIEIYNSQDISAKVGTANKEPHPLKFTIGDDNDVEIIWTVVEKEIQKALEVANQANIYAKEHSTTHKEPDIISDHVETHQKSSDGIAQQTDFPETTEQVMHDVLVKSEFLADPTESQKVASPIKSDDSNNDVKSEKHKKKKYIYTKDKLIDLKCTELKQLATKNDIKLSMKVDGKTKSKTKSDIIDDLLKIVMQ